MLHGDVRIDLVSKYMFFFFKGYFSLLLNLLSFYRIIESFSLGKTFKIIESNYKPNCQVHH